MNARSRRTEAEAAPILGLDHVLPRPGVHENIFSLNRRSGATP